MTHSRAHGLALVLFSPVFGQATPTDTEHADPERFAAVETARRQLESDPRDSNHLLAIRNTGSSAAGVRAASGTTDYNALIETSGDVATAGDEGGKFTLSFNRFFGLPTDQGYKVAATLNGAELYPPLRQALNDVGAASGIDDFEQQIDDFDDVTFFVAYSPTTRKLGRVLSRRTKEAESARLTRGARRPSGFVSSHRAFNNIVLAAIEERPQLQFFVGLTERHDLAGPDEFLAKVAYEMRGNDGLTFQAEYVDIKRYQFSSADDAVTLDLQSERKLSGSLVYRRGLKPKEGDTAAPRLDVNGTYEDFSNDPQRQSRGILTATYSQPTAEGLFLQVALTWATRSEFIGEADQRIGAHLGLTYKIGSPPE